ncbi:MAG: hypothetical protein ACOCNB_05485 [Acetivibrio ethanolgignens]
MERKELLIYIKKVQKRVFLKEAAEILLWYLFGGFGIGILINVISLLVPLYDAWRFSAGAVLLLFFLGICYGVLKFPRKKKAARFLDEKGLKERVTTALEQLEDDSEMARLQWQDTMERLKDFSVKESFPLKINIRKLLVLLGVLGTFAATALLPSKAKEEAVARHELSEQVKVQVQRAEEFKKLLDTEKELKELLQAGRKEALKGQLDQSIRELSSAKSEGELRKAQLRLEKKVEKALENGSFKSLSPKAVSLLESYLPGFTKEQLELAVNVDAGKDGSSGQSDSGEAGKTGTGGESGEAGTGAGNGKNGTGTGNGAGGKGSGTGTGYNYGSSQGIEKADKSNHGTPEQITIPGRQVGSDENLTGAGEDGTAFSQKGARSEGFRGEVVDYGTVLGEYSQAAYGQLGDGSIPAGMESVVKNYFDGLNE